MQSFTIRLRRMRVNEELRLLSHAGLQDSDKHVLCAFGLVVRNICTIQSITQAITIPFSGYTLQVRGNFSMYYQNDFIVITINGGVQK